MIAIEDLFRYLFFTLIPALIGIIWGDYKKKINKLEQRVYELEKDNHKLTKDDIRDVIKEEFTRFELKLINQGRLSPECDEVK